MMQMQMMFLLDFYIYIHELCNLLPSASIECKMGNNKNRKRKLQLAQSSRDALSKQADKVETVSSKKLCESDCEWDSSNEEFVGVGNGYRIWEWRQL